MKKSDFRSRLKGTMNIRGIKAVDLVEPTLLHKISGSRFKVQTSYIPEVFHNREL